MELPTHTDHRLQISEEDVYTKLNNLNIGKYPGPDNIQPRVLKELGRTLSKPLSIIYNTSLNTAVIPTEWKQAQITSIYKKRCKANCREQSSCQSDRHNM
jgi:hypothetical protein